MKYIKNIIISLVCISLMLLTSCQQQQKLSDGKYFKITEPELIESLNSYFNKDLEFTGRSDTMDDSSQEIISYSFNYDELEPKTVYYRIVCDKATQRVSDISFDVASDYPMSSSFYMKHITGVIESVSPNVYDSTLESIKNAAQKMYYDNEMYSLQSSPYYDFKIHMSYYKDGKMLSASIEPNHETRLSTGIYVVGEDIEEGEYNVEHNYGEGEFIVRGSRQIQEEFGDGINQVRNYNNLPLSKGDEIEISGNLEVYLILQ